MTWKFVYYEEDGCILLRHGRTHDWYHNPRTRFRSLFHDTGKSKTASHTKGRPHGLRTWVRP